MMSTFTLSPSTAMVGALLLCCSLFSLVGTANAAVAIRSTTTVLSTVARPAASTVTMMAMAAAGTSRTLIEIGNNNRDGDDDDDRTYGTTQPQFRIDITYLDEDYENGLLILRRANINDDNDASSSSTKNKFNPFLQKTLQAINNPIVASILIGNIASMIGLIPLGLSGFLPAISIAIFGSMKIKTPMKTTMKCFFSRPLTAALKQLKQLKELTSIALNKIKENDGVLRTKTAAVL
jgi:hypothetical protein